MITVESRALREQLAATGDLPVVVEIRGRLYPIGALERREQDGYVYLVLPVNTFGHLTVDDRGTGVSDGGEQIERDVS